MRLLFSTCHWCHVMERESFEDTEVADILNKNFISIKVDREERPDIDTIYMQVCQALTGHGGWPLTVFLTPERKPFFAGTYFPKYSTHRMPGLVNTLKQIAELWRARRNDITESSDQITRALQNSLAVHNRGEITVDALHEAFRHFEDAFDPVYGGFGNAPKFPTPHNLSFLMRYWRLSGNKSALDMVKKTLDSMYLGGIYDHVGFGFARYSTDSKWLVPHFEKMLYDNALLAIACLEAYQITRKDRYAQVARDVFTYIMRDMTSPEGAFYAAEDADSEGEEGRFYVWTPDEVTAVLGKDEGERFCKHYDITGSGNFDGKNIPNLIATGFAEDVGGDFTEDLGKLYQKREERVRPFKDDKIITSWNGLMIAALACGGRILDERRYAAAAEKAAGFILQNLRRADGRLLARYRDGEAAIPGYVDDYAFLVWGLIELYEATFRAGYLSTALELNRDMIKYFWDETHGGLFQYGSDAEHLITRPKEIYDGALPSGNSVAAHNFIRLARLTGDKAIEERAAAQLAVFGGTVSEIPMGHTHFLMAVYMTLRPSIEVNIIGDPAEPDTRQLVRKADSVFMPEAVLVVKEPGPEGEKISAMVPFIKQKEMINNKATAYVCKDFACFEPVNDSDRLEQMLQE